MRAQVTHPSSCFRLWLLLVTLCLTEELAGAVSLFPPSPDPFPSSSFDPLPIPPLVFVLGGYRTLHCETEFPSLSFLVGVNGVPRNSTASRLCLWYAGIFLSQNFVTGWEKKSRRPKRRTFLSLFSDDFKMTDIWCFSLHLSPRQKKCDFPWSTRT